MTETAFVENETSMSAKRSRRVVTTNRMSAQPYSISTELRVNSTDTIDPADTTEYIGDIDGWEGSTETYTETETESMFTDTTDASTFGGEYRSSDAVTYTEDTTLQEASEEEAASTDGDSYLFGLFGGSKDTTSKDELSREKLREQQRAALTRENAEEMRTDEGSTWETRSVPGVDRVRRATFNEESEEYRTSQYNTDALRSEYAGIYYEIQRGDTSLAQGLTTKSKQHYDNALKQLLSLKKRAPDWQSDIVNFRIDYCRTRLRSTE